MHQHEVMVLGAPGRQIEIGRGDAQIRRDEAHHRHMRHARGETLEIAVDGLGRGDLVPAEIAVALGDAVEDQLVGLEDLERMLMHRVAGARELRLGLVEGPAVIEPRGAEQEPERHGDDRREQQPERPKRCSEALNRRVGHRCSGRG